MAKKKKKYIATTDIPSLGMKSGQGVSGPVVDILLANGTAAELVEEETEEGR